MSNQQSNIPSKVILDKGIVKKDKIFIINSNSPKEIKKIIQSYINQYGNITIQELLMKLNADRLILN